MVRCSQNPGAKLVELPGNYHLPFVCDQDPILDEAEDFLNGAMVFTLSVWLLQRYVTKRFHLFGPAINLFAFEMLWDYKASR